MSVERAQIWTPFRLDCYTAEVLIFCLAGAMMAVNGTLYLQLQPQIDWAPYTIITVVSATLFMGGQFYRQSGRSPRLGAALICTSALIIFSMAASTFNYLLLPITRPTIDAWLVSVDQLYGYHWPDVVAFAGAHPTLSVILKLAYISTLPQLAVLVVSLGLTGRLFDLHVMLLGIAVTSVIGITFWGMFPSLGPATMFQIPAETLDAAGLVIGTDYGEKLLGLAADGTVRLSPTDALGLIAFPSFHLVLACFSVYAARTLPLLFPVFVGINILALPATLIHGGHHLIDLPAGMALFAFGAWTAHQLVAHRWPEEAGARVLAAEGIA